MIESIERMRKLVNDNLVMGLRFQMNGELNKLESEIEQELNSRAKPPCGGGYCPLCGAYDEWESYKHSVPATEENMAKFGWVRERTCHIEGSYYDELFDETCTNLSCGHAIWQNESPNYCSECGAKVVGE